MERKIIISLFFIVMYYCPVYAQSDELYHLDINSDKSGQRESLMPPAEKLNYRLFNKLIFPYQFNETCDAVFTAIVLPVRDNKLADSLVYEQNCPDAVKATFKRVIPMLQEQRWDKIFPALRDKKDYDIVLPFVYSFQVAGCWDTIPSKAVERRTAQVMDKRKDNEITSYCLPPLKISRFK